MSGVPKAGNEIDGCQVKTKFFKRTYVFCWSVENFKPYGYLFKVTSPEFRPESDRLFCATVERKYNSISHRYDVILSIFIKEGLSFEITHKIFIENSIGKYLHGIYATHKHSLESGCHPAFNFTIPDDRTIFINEYNKCINFRCEMEFDATSTCLRHNYPLPKSTITPSALVDDLKAIYAKSLTDLCLKVEKKVVGVHKALLCARSPVFTKMFEAPMDEKENNIIEITDIELPVVKGLVEFLYTGVLCNDDFDFVCDLYYAADKYDVSSLRKTCTDVLLAKLDIDNACPVLSLAEQHSDVQFKESVMEFILFHFDDILQTKNWSEFLDEETKLAAEVMRCRSLKSKKVSNNMPVT